MKPNENFMRLTKTFWASVRLISQEIGYTEKGTNQIKTPSMKGIESKLDKFGIDIKRLQTQKINNQRLDELLQDYFAYRADVLNSYVEPRLMNVKDAKRVFREHFAKLKPSCPIPMNKQTGPKKAPAYLTGLVNISRSRKSHARVTRNNISQVI